MSLTLKEIIINMTNIKLENDQARVNYESKLFLKNHLIESFGQTQRNRRETKNLKFHQTNLSVTNKNE